MSGTSWIWVLLNRLIVHVLSRATGDRSKTTADGILSKEMLKIGTLRWKGRCSRHPKFDPSDGEGGIRGACVRCYALLDIYRQHRQLMELMRAFGPVRSRTPTRLKVEELQPGLFD